jgi:dissimilatory sulfite reductase (desulfoviridin) alpha/beta subunit
MAIDYKTLKSSGFLPMRKKENFSMRVKVLGGNLTPTQLRTIADAAEEFGAGRVHLTSRQGVEIPFVKYGDIEPIKEFLAKGEVFPGVGGATVRTVTACQGNKVCPWGCVDTFSLASDISKKFSSKKIPHKFKIGVTGCANNCLKAEQNDLGVKGGLFVDIDFSKCKQCGLCVKNCKAKALTLVKGKEMKIDREKCVNCGKCANACPVKAWKSESGYKVYFGGTFGNRIAIAEELFPMLKDKKKVFRAAEIALDFFAKHGSPGERFRTLLDKIGWEGFKEALGEEFIPAEDPAKSSRKRKR